MPFIVPCLPYRLGEVGNPLALIAQLVKNPAAMQETPLQFLGREDPVEKR